MRRWRQRPPPVAGLPPQDPRLTGHTGRMTLNGAYLVDIDKGLSSRPRSDGCSTITRTPASTFEARGRRTPSPCWSSDVCSTPPKPPAGQIALVDLLDRLVGTGVVLAGDVVISLAGVDLVQVRLHALITSIRADMVEPP